MIKKILALALVACMLFAIVACGGGDTPTSAPDAPASAPAAEQPADDDTQPAPTADDSDAESATIRIFTNLPDRNNGQGLVEQMLIDAYLAENPHISIEIEALHDEEYKIKFAAYSAGREMPDFTSGWGMPSWIDERVDAGIFHELNPADFNFGFVEGTFAGFSKDGKLYGIPRNTDIMGFYYNQAIFDEIGVSTPGSWDELLVLANDIRAAGYQPVSTNGAEGWSIAIMLTGIYQMVSGPGVGARMGGFLTSQDWSDSKFVEAAGVFQDAAMGGLFANGFETSDYGTAKSLFTSGQAAMFYMGSWEASMAVDDDIPSEVRDNIRMFMLPEVSGGAGSLTDISLWNGGGYFVTADSPVADEAIKLLQYFFREDNWNRLTWEYDVCMSAQDFTPYFSGNESAVLLQFVDAMNAATAVTGVPYIDMGSADFKTRSERLIVELAIGAITPEQHSESLGTGT